MAWTRTLNDSSDFILDGLDTGTDALRRFQPLGSYHQNFILRESVQLL
jgi:hypothetical protein